jgi:hypothetical protein
VWGHGFLQSVDASSLNVERGRTVDAPNR